MTPHGACAFCGRMTGWFDYERDNWFCGLTPAYCLDNAAPIATTTPEYEPGKPRLNRRQRRALAKLKKQGGRG